MDALKDIYPADRFHPVLVTEVTRMQGGFFCVAGWDVHAGRIVRPLHPTGQNWRGRGEQPPFDVGQVIDCVYKGSEHGTPPHSHEDSVLQRTPRTLETVDEAKMHELLRPTVDASVPAIFGRRLADDQYLVDGVRCRSLGAVAVARGLARFVERFGRLRFRFRDSEGTY